MIQVGGGRQGGYTRYSGRCDGGSWNGVMVWDSTSDASDVLCSNMGIWVWVMFGEIAQRIRRRAEQDLVEIESGTGERSRGRIGTLM